MILWLQILNLLLFPQVCWGWLYGLGAFMVKMRKTVRTGVPSSSVRKRTGTSRTPASAEGFTSAPRGYQLNRKLRSFEPTKSKRSLKPFFIEICDIPVQVVPDWPLLGRREAVLQLQGPGNLWTRGT